MCRDSENGGITFSDVCRGGDQDDLIKEVGVELDLEE